MKKLIASLVGAAMLALSALPVTAQAAPPAKHRAHHATAKAKKARAKHHMVKKHHAKKARVIKHKRPAHK